MELLNKFFKETSKKSNMNASEEAFNLEECKAQYDLKEWYCEKKETWYVFLSKAGKTAIVKLYKCRLAEATTFVYLVTKEGRFGVLK